MYTCVHVLNTILSLTLVYSHNLFITAKLYSMYAHILQCHIHNLQEYVIKTLRLLV